MKKRYPKRVNPNPMITRFKEIFKPVGMKKQRHSVLVFLLYFFTNVNILT